MVNPLWKIWKASNSTFLPEGGTPNSSTVPPGRAKSIVRDMSGMAPVARFVERRLNTGLGTDGAASNNRLDLFEEMRIAALLAKATSGRANSVPAEAALHMATLGAARALGLDQDIGSIAPGKLADLCAVNLDATGLSPVYHPLSHLVYAAGREDVSHVWVAGNLVVDQGHLTGLDSGELRAKARAWQARIVDLS